MIALRRPQPATGYYWQVTDEYHYVPTLSELIVEVGRREASGSKLKAYQATGGHDGEPEIVSLLYSTENSHLAHIDVHDGDVVRRLANMRAVYALLARLLIQYNSDEIEITYSVSDPSMWVAMPQGDNRNALVECVHFSIGISYLKDVEEDVDWVKEGF